MTGEMLLRPWRRPPVKVSCPVGRRLDVSVTWHATKARRDWAAPESAAAGGILRSGVKHEGAAAEPVRTGAGRVKQPGGLRLVLVRGERGVGTPWAGCPRSALVPGGCDRAHIRPAMGRRRPVLAAWRGDAAHAAALAAPAGQPSQSYNGLTRRRSWPSPDALRGGSPMAEPPGTARSEVAAADRDVLLATKLHVPRRQPGSVPPPRLPDLLEHRLPGG